MVLSVTVEKEKSYLYSTQIVDALQELKEPIATPTQSQKAKKRRITLDLNADGEGIKFILFKQTILFVW